MIAIRIRCQCLKVIAAMDQGTAEDVHKHLPDLTARQVQKALADLCEDDEIRKIGVKARKAISGKPWNIYSVRSEEEPKQSRKKVYEKKQSIRNNNDLHKPVSVNGGLIFLKFRERKIKLLNTLLKYVNGTDKDILIGIINDFNRL